MKASGKILIIEFSLAIATKIKIKAKKMTIVYFYNWNILKNLNTRLKGATD